MPAKPILSDYLSEAHAELERRGIKGPLSKAEIRLINQYRATGSTAVEAGAQLAMDILRTI